MHHEQQRLLTIYILIEGTEMILTSKLRGKVEVIYYGVPYVCCLRETDHCLLRFPIQQSESIHVQKFKKRDRLD